MKAKLVNQMFQMNMKIGKIRRAFFEHTDDMTASEYLLLHHVIERQNNDQQQTISQIAQDLSFSNAAVSRVIKQLLAKNWVLREQLEQDRRNGVIKISEAGLVAYARIQEKLNARIERKFEHILAEDLEQYIMSAQQLVDRLEENER